MNRKYTYITEEDTKLIKELDISDHVLFAIDHIIKNGINYGPRKDNKKMKNLKDVISDSLIRRAELFYKYNF